APERRPRPWEKAPLRTDPITVAEIRAQKAANLAHLKRKARREEARLREVQARQQAETAPLRAAQAARDRAWRETRGRDG
ncbi:hypothetical protein NL482_26830, partial [Klebsiella pneumoniae]|nr:hypothetical protein [Klebsiella pneumoniae]